ncbi:hypothetical protein ACFL2V_09350 [Pseudomonadota bacterium]
MFYFNDETQDPPQPEAPVITGVSLREGGINTSERLDVNLHFTQDNTDDAWRFQIFSGSTSDPACQPDVWRPFECNERLLIDSLQTGGPYTQWFYVDPSLGDEFHVAVYAEDYVNEPHKASESSNLFTFSISEWVESRTSVEIAIDSISGIDTSNMSPQEIASLATAIERLEDSQGNLSPNGDQRIIWGADGSLDCKFGHVVFDDIKQAINQLESVNDPAIAGIVDGLVEAAKDLAQAEVDALPAGTEQDEAQAELDAVDLTQDAMQLVQDYRNIWKSVNAYCDNTPVQTCIADLEVTDGTETISAIGDEVGDYTTWLDPVADPTIADAFSVETSCNVCVEVGQDLGGGWSITEVNETKKDEGTLATVCGV